MSIPEHRRASNMDLSDEEFRRFPVEERNNIATVVMHILQQHDDFVSGPIGP